MTYQVIWSLAAVQLLGQVEQAADEPTGVKKAAEWIDYTLRRIPLNVGESRTVGHRLWYGDVLGVYYRVDEAALTVRVISVGPSKRR